MRAIKVFGVMLASCVCLMLMTAVALANQVTVTGHGATERDAIHDAMRAAIEQEVGVYVDSQTYVENYRVINDEIYMKSEGYIRSYEVLHRGREGGVYAVMIRADVTSEILRDDLMTKLQKHAVIAANMEDPRIGVMVFEEDGTENATVENKIINGLRNNGFSRLIDMRQIDASVKNRIANALYEGDADLVSMLQHQFNADYFVTGFISASASGFNVPVGDIPFLGEIGWRNVNVTIDIRMVNVNTGEIIYANSFSGDASGLSGKAESRALKEASKNIARELSREAFKKAANPEQHVTIIVTNGRLGSMSEAYARISRIPGVSGVYTRAMQGDNMQIDVDYHGTAHDLAQALERDGIMISEMNSEYIKI
ncbi:MAG: hypothetical protein IJT82_08640 [Schwartzia sp.]|nr:hypothetical protein [Schwartzia sp. (in: firmicutes)]